MLHCERSFTLLMHNDLHDHVHTACNSLRGNMRDQDVNRWGRRRVACMRGRVGALLSSWSSLEGTDTQLTLLYSLSLSYSLLTMVDLNNLSLIICLSTSHTQTHPHTKTCNYLSIHTHIHTCLRGLGSGGGVEWASWNLQRGKPDRHSLCQTYEVTLTDWSRLPAGLPACQPPSTAVRFKPFISKKSNTRLGWFFLLRLKHFCALQDHKAFINECAALIDTLVC